MRSVHLPVPVEGKWNRLVPATVPFFNGTPNLGDGGELSKVTWTWQLTAVAARAIVSRVIG